jgi:hypothetical protein
MHHPQTSLVLTECLEDLMVGCANTYTVYYDLYAART